MKKLLILIALVGALSIGVFAQDSLPSGFEFKADANGSYQLLPKDEEVLDETNNDPVRQFVGIAAQPEEEFYGLILYYIQPEKKDFVLGNQKKPKITVSYGNSDRTISEYSFEKRAVKGKRIEMVMFKISPEDYEKLQNTPVSILFGTYKFDISESNLEALRYFSANVRNDLAAKRRSRELPILNQSKEVHVKGYYRKDGTYVRPHTRRKP